MTGSLSRSLVLAVVGCGCDRPDVVEPASVEPASVEPASVEPAPVEPASVEPAPVEPPGAAAPAAIAPGAEPADPSFAGQSAAARLADILAEIEDAAPAVRASIVADTEKSAWADYRAGEYERAGDAFARLTKLDPAPWKHPFNAACAAARRVDSTRAQMFLVEALRRGGRPARDKARGDRDLAAVKVEPWFDELLAANDAALAGWTIRVTPLTLRLVSFAPGESPLAIRDVGVAVRGSYTSRPKIVMTVGFAAEKLARTDPVDLFVVKATCKSGERYLSTTGLFSARDDSLAPGKTAQLEGHPFHYLSWPTEQHVDHCEVEFRGQENRPAPATAMLFAEHCWVGGRVEAGACSGFAPSSEDPSMSVTDVQVVVEPPRDERPRWQLWWYVELRFGTAPEIGESYYVEFRCDERGKAATQRGPLMLPGLVWHLVAGESTQAWAIAQLEAEPTRCEVQLERRHGRPLRVDTVATHCFAAGKAEAGACAT